MRPLRVLDAGMGTLLSQKLGSEGRAWMAGFLLHDPEVREHMSSIGPQRVSGGNALNAILFMGVSVLTFVLRPEPQFLRQTRII
jgi:hypothetical protein